MWIFSETRKAKFNINIKKSENVKLSNYKTLSFLNYQQLKEMIDDFSSLHYAIVKGRYYQNYVITI